MVFDIGLIQLILKCIQHFGVSIGLGAQTIMLVAYLITIRDGVVDDYEAQFLRATKRTLLAAFVVIVVSGICITAIEYLGGKAETILQPAYLFKWLLIVVVLLPTAALAVLPETFAIGFVGGTWYALFLVHILAPVTTWFNLLTIWALWLAGFMSVWYALVYFTHDRHAKSGDGKSKPIAPKNLDATPEPVKADPPPPPVLKPVPIIIERTPMSDLKPIALSFPPAPAVAPMPVPTPVPTPMPASAPMPPMAPPAPPLPKIKMDTMPMPYSQMPVEKAPASIATDTPFLPQVPPLQPIPTLAAMSAKTFGTAAGGSAVPQNAPADSNATSSATSTLLEEVKLGLTVMPKSPDQIKQ